MQLIFLLLKISNEDLLLYSQVLKYNKYILFKFIFKLFNTAFNMIDIFTPSV